MKAKLPTPKKQPTAKIPGSTPQPQDKLYPRVEEPGQHRPPIAKLGPINPTELADLNQLSSPLKVAKSKSFAPKFSGMSMTPAKPAAPQKSGSRSSK